MMFVKLLITVLLLLLCGCSGKQIPDVAKLSLRDPGLSIDARRWLADAEDEVVIARAGVELAASRVARIEEYKSMLTQEQVFQSGPGNKGNVDQMEQSLFAYVEAQLALEEAQLDAAESGMALAKARLTQVRAETAIRYDLAVYPMAPIVRQVEMLKQEVSAANSVMEDLHITVEKAAATLWRNYSTFVQQGGVTRNFWKYRSL